MGAGQCGQLNQAQSHLIYCAANMNALVDALKAIAPTLATAVAGPLGGAAVSLIASKFGVQDTVESVAKAIAGDPAAEEKLRELEFKYAQMYAEDRKSARDMQMEALRQNDVFSKRFVYYLAIGWSLFAIVYIFFITFGTIPMANVRFADTILGFVLGTVIATMMNFFFGTSRSSEAKTEKLVSMAGQTK